MSKIRARKNGQEGYITIVSVPKLRVSKILKDDPVTIRLRPDESQETHEGAR